MRAAIFILAMGAGVGAVQPGEAPRYGQPGSNLRAVDAGNEGSPLSKDLRVTPLDLRRPTAFDRVYEVRVGPNRTVKYARVDGALVALFDRGAYEATARGDAPLIPSGTTFMIGDPEKLFADQSATERPRRTEAFKIDNWMGEAPISLREPTLPEEAKPALPPTMWTSDTVRRERVKMLLERAWGK